MKQEDDEEDYRGKKYPQQYGLPQLITFFRLASGLPNFSALVIIHDAPLLFRWPSACSISLYAKTKSTFVANPS